MPVQEGKSPLNMLKPNGRTKNRITSMKHVQKKNKTKDT